MNTHKTFRSVTLVLFASFVYGAFSLSAHATVGGSTYIGSFTYNSADESVYFVENSLSGRGCPPMLKKISLTSEVTDTAFSCDQGEALQQSSIPYTDVEPKVMEKIGTITSGFKNLIPINLLKNNIDIVVKFVASEPVEPGSEWIITSRFTATVYQDGSKIDEFPINGCNTEQPFSFAGYAIPGFQKKIVLLSSTKGDCFEGGYTVEKLRVIGSVTLVDTSDVPNHYKYHKAPLTPDEGTLVVRVSSSTQTTGSTNTKSVLILGGIMLFVAGMYAGNLWMKK